MVIPKKERIYKYEFDKILSLMPEISLEERRYLYQAFSAELADGMTEWELRDKINKLRFNREDNIEEWELEKLKKKLLSILGKQ